MNLGLMVKSLAASFGVRVTEEQAEQMTAAVPGIIATMQKVPEMVPLILRKLSDMEARNLEMHRMLSVLYMQRTGTLGGAIESQYAAMMKGEIDEREEYRNGSADSDRESGSGELQFGDGNEHGNHGTN